MKDTEILKVTAELENDSLWACNSDEHISNKSISDLLLMETYWLQLL